MARTAADRLRALQGPGQIWSYSSLNRFESCPHSYLGRYVDQISDPPSGIVVQGRLAYAAATLLIRGSVRVPEAAVAAARQAEAEQALVPATMDATLAHWATQAAAGVPDNAGSVIAEEVWVHPLPRRPAAPCLPSSIWRLANRPCASGSPTPGFVCRIPCVKPARMRLWPARTWLWPKIRRPRSATGKRAGHQPRDQRALFRATRLSWRSTEPWRVAGSRSRRWSLNCKRWSQTRWSPCPSAPTTWTPEPVGVFATGQAIKAAARWGRSAFTKWVGEACPYCALAQGVNDAGQPYCPEGVAYRHRQGWDRWDTQHQIERRAAGIPWMGDPSTVEQPQLFGLL